MGDLMRLQFLLMLQFMLLILPLLLTLIPFFDKEHAFGPALEQEQEQEHD
jgi:hypothetical protein